MEQTLLEDKKIKVVMENSDSIGLIKLIEKICYNYQSHEFDPLGGWEVMD